MSAVRYLVERDISFRIQEVRVTARYVTKVG